MEEKKQGNKKAEKTFLVILGTFLFSIIVFLLIPLYRPVQSSDEPGYVSSTNEFHQRMKKCLDISEIQEWLSSLSESGIENSYYNRFEVNSFPMKLPDTIRNLKQEISYIEIYRIEEGDICVKMLWGGPIARWGVVVGPQKMLIPQTIDVGYDEEGYRSIGEYRIKLQDGAYVWHEIK